MGQSHWPERMPGSCYDSEIDDSCIAFLLEEAHRSPSRSGAYLNGARLGQSLEMREARRRNYLLFRAYTRHIQRAEARPFMLPDG